MSNGSDRDARLPSSTVKPPLTTDTALAPVCASVNSATPPELAVKMRNVTS